MSIFDEIYAVVSTIPKGSVASYGQVAAAWGKPRGAQVVGWAMGALPPDTNVPWARVINKQRRLSIVNPRLAPQEQAMRLVAEGREIVEKSDGLYVSGEDWYSFSE